MNDADARRARHELDNAWDRALSMNLSRLDALCAEVCAEYEAQLSDLPTWETLAPFYGEVR